ncbi:binding protein [[Candida] boidinii]|nr:binding protein [[Candida] boidinii]
MTVKRKLQVSFAESNNDSNAKLFRMESLAKQGSDPPGDAVSSSSVSSSAIPHIQPSTSLQKNSETPSDKNPKRNFTKTTTATEPVNNRPHFNTISDSSIRSTRLQDPLMKNFEKLDSSTNNNNDNNIPSLDNTTFPLTSNTSDIMTNKKQSPNRASISPSGIGSEPNQPVAERVNVENDNESDDQNYIESDAQSDEDINTKRDILDSNRVNQEDGVKIDDESVLQEDHSIEITEESKESQDKQNKEMTKRRAVACKACHSLKVKCVPVDENVKFGPCQRCTKAKRFCQFDLTNTRKRKNSKLKPTNKIQELELQIQELKDKLMKQEHINIEQINQLKKQQMPQNQNHNTFNDGSSQTTISVGPMTPGIAQENSRNGGSSLSGSVSSQKQPKATSRQPISNDKAIGDHRDAEMSEASWESSVSSPQLSEEEMMRQLQIRKFKKEIQWLDDMQHDKLISETSAVVAVADRRTKMLADRLNPDNYDVIAKGWLTKEQCQEMINKFVFRMWKWYPFIDLDLNSLTVDSLKQKQPILLLTILFISTMLETSTSEEALDLQLKLEILTFDTLSGEILSVGNKSLELLRCLILICVWYNSPELFHHRRYHLLTSLCVSMVHDLGLSGRPYFFYNKEEGTVKKAAILENPQNLESKALILVVYLSSVSIALFLRRRIPVQFTDYSLQCCIDLENSGIEKFQRIALYARLNNLLEKTHYAVHSPSDILTLSELSSNRYRYVSNILQSQLDAMKQTIKLLSKHNKKDFDNLMAYYYSIQAYLHEPALHRFFTEESITSDPNIELPSHLAENVEKCSTSCFLALTHFAQLAKDDIAVMPLFYSSRIMYSAGILLRLRYLCISVPAMTKYEFITNETMASIRKLNELIYASSLAFPRNNFLGKMRLVLSLFAQTYSTQCKVSLQNLLNVNNVKSQNNNASKEEHQRKQQQQQQQQQYHMNMSSNYQNNQTNNSNTKPSTLSSFNSTSYSVIHNSGNQYSVPNSSTYETASGDERTPKPQNPLLSFPSSQQLGHSISLPQFNNNENSNILIPQQFTDALSFQQVPTLPKPTETSNTLNQQQQKSFNTSQYNTGTQNVNYNNININDNSVPINKFKGTNPDKSDREWTSSPGSPLEILSDAAASQPDDKEAQLQNSSRSLFNTKVAASNLGMVPHSSSPLGDDTSIQPKLKQRKTRNSRNKNMLRQSQQQSFPQSAQAVQTPIISQQSNNQGNSGMVAPQQSQPMNNQPQVLAGGPVNNPLNENGETFTGTDAQGLEYSYWALNDEFWSDLIVSLDGSNQDMSSGNCFGNDVNF